MITACSSSLPSSCHSIILLYYLFNHVDWLITEGKSSFFKNLPYDSSILW